MQPCLSRPSTQPGPRTRDLGDLPTYSGQTRSLFRAYLFRGRAGRPRRPLGSPGPGPGPARPVSSGLLRLRRAPASGHRPPSRQHGEPMETASEHHLPISVHVPPKEVGPSKYGTSWAVQAPRCRSFWFRPCRVLAPPPKWAPPHPGSSPIPSSGGRLAARACCRIKARLSKQLDTCQVTSFRSFFSHFFF